MKSFLRHYFLPHQSNNHRAKLLHAQVVFSLVVVLFVASFFVTYVKVEFPQVLGVSVSISYEDLLSHTNKKRLQNGRDPLVLNNELSRAALEKAHHMFEYNYWAHTAPNGTTPWVFIKKSGYTYVYAGENLARGFKTSEEVVDAWMASPTHKENMLSDNYQDIGFAVATGKLNGEDTVLVVEMFGGKTPSTISNNRSPSVIVSDLGNSKNANPVLSKAVVDSDMITRNISLIIISMFIIVLLLDMIIVERRKIVRLVGHNTDHVIFLGIIALCIAIISQGVVA